MLHLAKKVAKKSTHKYQVGAVLCKNRKPVSFGCNVPKTHPVHANPNVSVRRSIHAEIAAILAAKCGLYGTTIYIYRETKNGKPALAKPCKYCMNLLRRNGVKNIIYTIDKYPYYERIRL